MTEQILLRCVNLLRIACARVAHVEPWHWQKTEVCLDDRRERESVRLRQKGGRSKDGDIEGCTERVI